MFRAVTAVAAALAVLTSTGTRLRADDPAELVKSFTGAMKLHEDGKYAEAAVQFEKALKLSTGLFGPDNQLTVAIMNNLANTYKDLGKYDQAVALHLRTLAARERTLGRDHADVGQSANNLALVYWLQGKYDKAEPLFIRGLEVREKTLGRNHPDVAQSLNNLGVLYREMGKHEKAEPLHLRALAIREGAYGKEHVEVAMSLNNLAMLYMDQAKLTRAEAYYQRALNIYEKVLGGDHPDVAMALNNLGAVYREQGKHAQAEPLYRRALVVFESLGKDHPKVGLALNNLSQLCDDQGRYVESEALAIRALGIREKSLGRDHIDVAESLDSLASVYKSQGKYADALPISERALAIRERALGKEHALVAASFDNLANLYADLGRKDEAEPLYLRALGIEEKAFGPVHPKVATTLHNLAIFHKQQGNYSKAESMYLRSLDIREKSLGRDHPLVGGTVFCLGNLCREQGREAEAERYYQRSLEIDQRAFGVSHPDVASDHFQLAATYLNQAKPAEAAAATTRVRQTTRLVLLRELPSMSPKEQKQFLDLAERYRFTIALSLGYRHRSDPAIASASAGWLANGKAIATEALTIRGQLEREIADPDGKRMLAEVRDLRSQESALALRAGSAVQRGELEARRRDLEKQLAQKSATAAKVATPWVELDAVRKAIPADGVLIDIARFRPHRLIFKKGEKEYDEAERYVAWVVPPSGAIRVIDLGEAGPIDEAVSAANGHIKEASRRLFDQKTGGQVVKGAEDEEKVEAETAVKLAAVARLVFDPLRAAVGDARKLILSPDGDLWLLPWAALPVGKGRYLVEDYSVRLVVSGRDLVEPARVGAAVRPAAAVIVADPDYDRPPAGGARLVNRRCAGTIGDWKVVFAFGPAGVQIIDQAEGYVAGEGTWAADGDRLTLRTKLAVYTGEFADGGYAGEQVKTENGVTSKSRWAFRVPAGDPASRGLSQDADRIPRAPRLPGTVAEARLAEAKLKQATHADPRVYAQAAATKTQVQGTKSPEVLALMTHGYFLPRQEVELRDEPRAADVGGGRAAPVPKDKSGREVENPLLRCGLLFAGANRRGEAGGGDNGVLTGQEVVSLDLRGTKLVVLSACETAVGESQTGEGVAGLRQAFQLAGAEGVLATLWQIDDEATARLMGPFYDRLAGSADRAEALTQAQRQFLQDRRKRYGAAHPYFWAAFTMTGK